MMLSRFRPVARSTRTMASKSLYRGDLKIFRAFSSKMQPSISDTSSDHHNRPFVVSELLALELQRWKLSRAAISQERKATDQAEMKRNAKFEKELHEFDQPLEKSPEDLEKKTE